MKDLHSIPIYKFTITQQQVYDKLLRFITIIRQKVKNNLRHVYMGEIEWSHQYKKSKTVKRLWNRFRMRKQTVNHFSHVILTTIRRLMRQTKLNNVLLATTRKIEVYWIDACKTFEAVHKRAKDLNEDHLITLDQVHAKANGTTKASKKKL